MAGSHILSPGSFNQFARYAGYVTIDRATAVRAARPFPSLGPAPRKAEFRA
jgi:hypothetical protein